MPTRTIRQPSEIDPRFKPVVDSFIRKRDVTGGRLMASYGLKVSGKIFAMFGRGEFVAKLPKERVDQLIAEGAGKRFDPGTGIPMKEWIAIRSRESEWVALAAEAYAFVKRGIADSSRRKTR